MILSPVLLPNISLMNLVRQGLPPLPQLGIVWYVQILLTYGRKYFLNLSIDHGTSYVQSLGHVLFFYLNRG